MIMKTINRIALVSTACIIAAGCAKDDSANNFAGTAATMKVVVNDEIGTSRVAFADGEGIAWENGDHECFYRIVKNLEGAVKASEIATADDGKTATFTFPAVDEDTNIWFVYASPLNMSDGKFEYTFLAEQKQSAVGRMNKENIFLRSDMQTVVATEKESVISPKMRLVGTLQRFLVYSATGAYADESIEYVEMEANENIVGLIGYNTAGEPVIRSGEVQDAETIYWSESKRAKVTVAAPSAVAATSRETTLGHGIYLSVPPVTISAGYTYTITTDKATYTLIGPSAKTFNNGELVNIFVNLESENVRRVELNARELVYAGGLGDSYTVPSDAATTGLSYWYATVDGVVMQNNDANAHLYTNVEFSITDEAGNSVDWIKCGYRANDTWWDVVCEANTSAEPRTAVIRATYTVPNYTIVNPTKTVRVTQGGHTTEQVLTYENKNIGNQTHDFNSADYNTGLWFVAYINGIAKDGGFHDQPYYRNVEFITEPDASSWLELYLPDNNNNIWAKIQENTTGVERSTTVTVKYTGTDDGYTVSDADRIVGTFTFTQTAE